MDIAAAERAIGYKFKDNRLLTRALTHSSASRTDNYEKLEFLGDSVIQLAVTKWLYANGGDEGEMTAERQRLVSHWPLKRASEALGLTNYIINVGDVGEKALSSVYEAVAGAIFADGGFAAAERFIKRTLISAHPKIIRASCRSMFSRRARRCPSTAPSVRAARPTARSLCATCSYAERAFRVRAKASPKPKSAPPRAR